MADVEGGDRPKADFPLGRFQLTYADLMVIVGGILGIAVGINRYVEDPNSSIVARISAAAPKAPTLTPTPMPTQDMKALIRQVDEMWAR